MIAVTTNKIIRYILSLHLFCDPPFLLPYRLYRLIVIIIYTTERPAVAQDQAIPSGGSGSYAVRMCHVDHMRSWDFGSLRTAHHKLLLRVIGFRRKDGSGTNPYRMERLSRGPVPNASKRQFRSANLGLYSARRLKSLKVS